MHSSAQAYAEAHHILFVDPDVPAVAGVSLSGAKHDLVRGEKLQLSASLLPSGAVTGRECFWSSDDESVAIVDENGLVTALGTNVSRIGSGAFAGMGNLKQVEIPSASLSIAESAFEGSSPAIVCREGSPAYVFAVLHDLRVVYPEEE